MSKTERKFRDGDAIFLEGDPGGEAFEVIKGAVELSCISPEGRTRLGLLDPGQFFGDGNSLDKGKRTMTARAIGPVTAKSIPLKELPNKKDSGAQKSGPGIFKRFFGGLNLGASPECIEIRVAPLISEVPESAEAQTRHLLAALGGRSNLRARILNNAPPFTLKDDPIIIATTARQFLINENADLLIWGEIPHPGTTLNLRFVSLEEETEDIAGRIDLTTTLKLPVGFGPEFTELFLTVSLAALTLKNDVKNHSLTELMAAILPNAIPVTKNLPRDLTQRERGNIHMCLGNAMAGEAEKRCSSDLYQMAAQTFRTALDGISREDTPFDWGITHKNLGAVLQGMTDRSSNEETHNTIAESYKEALKELTKKTYPLEWAITQNRLGLTLYKLDIITGDIELIKQAITAYQNALQVFTRTETPLLWADTMNNFAQAAQILGEQLRNPEVLGKSASACRQALEVRKKDKMPLQWATSQNNLGSALFLLGKLNNDLTPLKESAEAFKKALDFYQDNGTGKMAAIASKNLCHAERLIEKHTRPSKV